jgi:hypothetical protein
MDKKRQRKKKKANGLAKVSNAGFVVVLSNLKPFKKY